MAKYNKFLSGNLRILLNGRNKKCSATILNFQGVFHSCPQLADVNIFFLMALRLQQTACRGKKQPNSPGGLDHILSWYKPTQLSFLYQLRSLGTAAFISSFAIKDTEMSFAPSDIISQQGARNALADLQRVLSTGSSWH